MKPSSSWKAFLLSAALASGSHAALVSHYDMEDAASPLTDQEGGQTASAVDLGQLYAQPGPLGFGNAVALNDNGSWQLSLADSAEVNLANDFTVMCWVYVDSTVEAGKTGLNVTNNRILGDDAGWDADGWSFGIRAGQLLFTKNGIVDALDGSQPMVPVDQWVNVAVVVSSTSGITYYIDGSVSGGHGNTADNNTGLGNNGLEDPYAIGRSYGNAEAQWFAGSLDELRVYDTPLTQAEIAEIMSPDAPALLGVSSPQEFTNNGLVETLVIPFSNSGDSANLVITGVTPTAGDTSFFSASTFDSDVAPGDSGTISLDFDPTQAGGGAGVYTVTLTVVSNDAFSPSKPIEVTVEVIEPIAVVTPASLDFGSFPPSPGVQSITVNIANDGGSEDLTINSILVFDDFKSSFSVVGTFPMTVAAQSSVDVTINFEPGASDGYFTAELDIDTNGALDAFFTIPLSAVVELADPGASLVSLFTFDDAGNLGDDTGSFDNDGTVVGDAQQSTSSRIGAGALLLDGDGDLLDLGVESGLDYTDELIFNFEGFSAMCWAVIPSDSPSSVTRFFSTYMADGFAGEGWGAGHQTSSLLLGTTYGLIDYFSAPDSAPPRGAWHHFAYIYRNDPINRVDYYVDGVLVDSQTRAQAGLNSTGTNGFAIGALGLSTAPQYFDGRIDDLRIYDRELTPGNIAALYNAAPPLSGYDSWASSFGLDPAGDGAPELDSEGDGLDNAVEFVLGSSPIDPVQTHQLKVTVGAGGASFVYSRKTAAAEAGFIDTLEYSENLVDWTTAEDGTNDVVITVRSVDADTQEVTVLIPTTGQLLRFGRVAVAIP